MSERSRYRTPPPIVKQSESRARSCIMCKWWDEEPLPFHPWEFDEKTSEPTFEAKCWGWYKDPGERVYGSFPDETCDRWEKNENPRFPERA